MELDVIDETGLLNEEQLKMIEELIQFAGGHLELEEQTELSITFVSDVRIREINRDYRGKDAVTDVISFALEDETEDDMEISFAMLDEAMPKNIGDMLISVNRAREQAKEYGHSFERELGFLAVHGFLHLNGYDHMEPADEKEMFDLQKEILDAYGLKR